MNFEIIFLKFIYLDAFFLMLNNRVVGVSETIVRFSCFFTILTNILVAIIYTSQLFSAKSKTSFFIEPALKRQLQFILLLLDWFTIYFLDLYGKLKDYSVLWMNYCI